MPVTEGPALDLPEKSSVTNLSKIYIHETRLFEAYSGEILCKDSYPVKSCDALNSSLSRRVKI